MSAPAPLERRARAEGDEIVLPDGRRIHATVDDWYGALVDTFVQNFHTRQDLGAACAVFVRGRPVVDLWGGVADAATGRAWGADTAAVIFSCTKGILAVCAYLLVQDGSLELDAPVARWWPEFAGHGKGAITVREVLAHRAGLAWLDADLSLDDVLAWTPVIRAIEQQAPSEPPYAGYRYHPLTYGWLVGELIRRVGGTMPGRFFRDRLGDPLGLRTWIGTPPAVRATVARMEPPLPDEDSDAARLAARLAATDPAVTRGLTMGGAFGFPVEDGRVSFNDPRIQGAEVPGANGVSTAASLARLYAACVSPVDGRPVLHATSLDDALRVQSSGPQLSGIPDDGARWGTGFQLSSDPVQPMLGATSFGHAGAGGQLAFGDREHEVGFAYLSNQMGGYGDARARSLTTALRAALGA